MTYCTECSSVEQGTITKEVDGEEYEVCACCEADDSVREYDEDAGEDR